MLISYVTLDKLPNLFVPRVSFLENEEDNVCLAVYLMGILAEQMSLCSVYEVLKEKMLIECKVCFHCTNCHHSLVLLLISAQGRALLLWTAHPTGFCPCSPAPAALLPINA